MWGPRGLNSGTGGGRERCGTSGVTGRGKEVGVPLPMLLESVNSPLGSGQSPHLSFPEVEGPRERPGLTFRSRLPRPVLDPLDPWRG